MTTIVHKRGIGIPSADDLSVGEIAIDTSTGTAYTKNNAGEVVPVGGDSGGGEIDDSNYVKLDDDNQIGSEFYLHNADWTFSISDGEVFSQYVVGQHIAVGGEGYRSIKSDLNRVGYDAFAVINSDGSQSMSINQAGVVQAQDYLDADGNSIIGGGGTELPEGSSDGSVLTWQTDAWKPSQKFQFQEKPTNEIVAGTSGITLAATDAETKLDLNLNGFEFSHGYQPARVWIKKNPYESDPSELHVDQVFATDYLDADGNSIIGGGGGGDVDLTGYATETWVSANYQVKGNYLTSNSLNGYATETWVNNNYQPRGNYLTGFTESDPTVPSWVTSITQNDINKWNNPPSGGSYTQGNGI